MVVAVEEVAAVVEVDEVVVVIDVVAAVVDVDDVEVVVVEVEVVDRVVVEGVEEVVDV